MLQGERQLVCAASSSVFSPAAPVLCCPCFASTYVFSYPGPSRAPEVSDYGGIVCRFVSKINLLAYENKKGLELSGFLAGVSDMGMWSLALSVAMHDSCHYR